MRNRKEVLQMFGLLRPGLLMNTAHVEKSNTTLEIARKWNEVSRDTVVIFELQSKEKRELFVALTKLWLAGENFSSKTSPEDRNGTRDRSDRHKTSSDDRRSSTYGLEIIRHCS